MTAHDRVAIGAPGRAAGDQDEQAGRDAGAARAWTRVRSHGLNYAGAVATSQRGGHGNSTAPLRQSSTPVRTRAVDAAAHDRRFQPVTVDELDDIEIEISVLTTPSAVESVEEIVIGRHGIVLEKDGRRAVFLPQVAPDQGWTREETLSHLSQKMGLQADAWQQGATFQVFEAQVFKEAR